MANARTIAIDFNVAANPKAGYKSTEFWTHVFTLAISAGSFVAAVIHPGFKVPVGVESAVAPAAIGAAIVSQVAYVVSRNGLKRSALAAAEAWSKSYIPTVKPADPPAPVAPVQPVEVPAAPVVSAPASGPIQAALAAAQAADTPAV